MKRRSFLQLLGLATIAPLVKSPSQEQPLPSLSTINEEKEYDKKEWGSKYDENIAIAQRACSDMNLVEVMEAPPLFGNNPEVIKRFCEIGKKLLLLICIVFLSGCHTDNRIRVKPTLDYKIDPIKKAEYRLYVTRKLWAQDQLRRYETDSPGND